MEVRSSQKTELDSEVKKGRRSKRSASAEATGALIGAAEGTSSATSISEEELFADIVKREVKRTKTSDEFTTFETLVANHVKERTRDDGFINWEKVGKGALRGAVKKELLTREEAQQIYSRSFAAAQLDSDSDTLLDSIGSSKATMQSDQALNKSQVTLEKLIAGTQTLTIRDLKERSDSKTSAYEEEVAGGSTGVRSADTLTPNGTSFDGGTGFLFKPVSDTQGKLVVLTPEQLTGKVAGISLFDSSGKLVEKGLFSGVGNGEREHFRFTKAGSSYPDGLTVQVALKGGGSKSWYIPDPSLRYD